MQVLSCDNAIGQVINNTWRESPLRETLASYITNVFPDDRRDDTFDWDGHTKYVYPSSQFLSKQDFKEYAYIVRWTEPNELPHIKINEFSIEEIL